MPNASHGRIAPPDGSARIAPSPHDLIAKHMGLAARVAACYRGRRIEAADLESIAALALCQAAGRYDLRFDEDSFPHYAERLMRSAIRDALCAAPVVHLGRAAERRALRGEAAGWGRHGVPVGSLGLAVPSRPVEPDTAAVLSRAVAALADDERDMLDLVAGDGLTKGRAARQLGLSLHAGRAAYARAIARCTAALAEAN